jgi:hypothetical protein
MVEIRIDNTGDGTWWLYNDNDVWKDYCGCDNFDEQVILAGNRHCKECTDAEWYQAAKDILNDIDCYDEYPEYTSEEVNAKLKELYDKCRCTEDIIVDVLRLLYPEDAFKDGTIRGYCQGDWQDYIVKGDVDTDLLEEMYFGKISDITVTTDEEKFGDIITHDELWRAEREEGLKEYFRKRYELDKDEEIHILQADGYKQILDWKEVI